MKRKYIACRRVLFEKIEGMFAFFGGIWYDDKEFRI